MSLCRCFQLSLVAKTPVHIWLLLTNAHVPLVRYQSQTAEKTSSSDSHLQLLVLLLKVLVFVRVTVRKLVNLDTVLLNLFSDLQRNKRVNDTISDDTCRDSIIFFHKEPYMYICYVISVHLWDKTHVKIKFTLLP